MDDDDDGDDNDVTFIRIEFIISRSCNLSFILHSIMGPKTITFIIIITILLTKLFDNRELEESVTRNKYRNAKRMQASNNAKQTILAATMNLSQKKYTNRIERKKNRIEEV